MEIQGHQKTKTKMAVVNPRISITILNVNGQNTPIKMQSVVVGKKRPNYMLPSGEPSQLQRQT